jgi:peptide/nickel transport system permease protein
MIPYIIRRLLQSIVTLFILSIIFFFLARQQAGNPCPTVGCTEILHLDQPIANQYLYWVGHIIHGDFGTSTVGDPIGSVILQKLSPTVLLVGVSLAIQQLIALPLGILAALRPYSVLDQSFTFLTYVCLSIPAFLLGFFLIYLFAVHWTLLPVAHYEDEAIPLLWTSDWFAALKADPGYVLGDLVHHLILPVAALTATGVAVDSRFMRASMLQVLHQDYIRTAKAKGLRRRQVIFKHAFRNALLPIITNIGLYLPALLGGTVAVEAVFSWGGLGYAFAGAVGALGTGAGGDFAFLEALAMLSAVAVILANLLADLTYAWLDPRIRYGSTGVD